MKYALIIGNNNYDDPKLAQLKTPAADSAALAKVLDDKTIGSFDEVTSLLNQSESQVRRAVSAFLTEKKPDDLVLLYFSGHGVLDDRGRLYLALKDTQVNLLKATSIPSSFVADEMDSCRSRRQILVLDCCHSGAFARGTKGDQKAITETTFEGSGFGRVVLTASDSTQYALEGDQVIKQTDLSLFTHFLLEGLKTGEADMNNDGLIALDEWYDYTYTRVVAETPRQVPHKWSYNQQGDLIIARNPFLKKKAVELPYELVQAMESPFVGIRESAVTEVGKYLKSRDSEMVTLAVSALEKMKNDDSRRISSLAEKLLSESEQTRLQTDKATSPKTTIPEIAKASNDELVEMPQIKAETRISQPNIAQESIPVDNSIPLQKSVFNPSFWFKWIAIAVLGIIASSMLLDFDASIRSNEYGYLSYFLVIAFGLVAGGLSFIQWLLFRDRLADWWIVGNVAVGVTFCLVHRSRTLHGWDHLTIFLTVWLIGNFVVGLIFIRQTENKPRNFLSLFPSKRATKLGEIGETSTRRKSEAFALDRLFWSKWLGLCFLMYALGFAFYFFIIGRIQSSEADGPLFAIVIGLIAFVQWRFFRGGLRPWWIGANAANGFLLGSIQHYLPNHFDWPSENLLLLVTLGTFINFVGGIVLISTAKPVVERSSPIVETGARSNSFMMLLSVSLILTAIANTLTKLQSYDALPIFGTLYGISAVLLSVSYFLKKDIPRNFGFIALATFSLIDGIITVILANNPGNPVASLIPVDGILALASGVFFISQKETWKNLGFLMFSGYLILAGAAGLTFLLYESSVAITGWFISSFFAVPAAILFLLRK
jgi:uncharacterized caspase-like protein